MTLPAGYDPDPSAIVVFIVSAAFLGFICGAVLVALAAVGRPR